jgi:NADH-ubiquinone oxidoreductase chain 2
MILIIAIAITPNKGGISPILFTRLTSIIFLFSGALSYNALYIQSIGSGISIYSGLFQVTVLSQSFEIVLFILASMILIPWSNNFNIKLINNESTAIPSSIQAIQTSDDNISIESYIKGGIIKEYSLIILFSTLGSSLLLSSSNLLSMYLSIELQSFGVYILASIYRDSESATNAGLKYFLLGGLSSCLILLGCVLIYSYTGVIFFEDIYSLLVTSNNIDINTIIQLGLIIIFIGFLFKIAAAPFHNWAPDVYNDVPSIVTTWLTIMPKIAIIVLLTEIISTINLDVLSSIFNSNIEIIQGHTSSTFGIAEGSNYNINLIKNLLLISSFLSLIIGTIVGLAQTKIKRLLAYSTISHIGFLLLALSVNTEESLESLLFYLIQYSFTNLNIFFIILSFGYILKNRINITNNKYQNSDIMFISELKGQFISNPLLSLSLGISLFSMAGIPPLLGFFAKAGVLYSATQNGYYFISIVAIVVSVISAYYYLQIIRVMHFDTITNKEENGPILSNDEINSNLVSYNFNNNMFITNTHSFIISALTLSLLLFILKPSILLNSIHLMALNIFYS